MAVSSGVDRLPGTSMSNGFLELRHQLSATVEVALLDPQGVIVAVNDAWRAFTLSNGGDPRRTGVGMSYLDACSGSDDVPTAYVASAVREAIAGGLPAPVMITISCDAPDLPRSFDVFVSSRLADDGTCLGATVTLAKRPTTEAPSDEARWNAVEDRAAGPDHRVADILGVCSSIVSDLSRHAVLRNTVEAARTLTQARYAAIGLADTHGRVIDFEHVDTDGVVADQTWALSHAQVMLAMVSESARPLRWRHLDDPPGADGIGVRPPSLDSLLAVGLQGSGRADGVLYLANSHWGEFDAEDEAAMCALVEFTGRVLDEALRREDHEHREQDRAREVTATELKQQVVEIFDETRQAAGLGGNVYFAGMAEQTVPAALAADVEHVVRQGLSNMTEHADVGVIVVGLSLTEALLTVDLIDDGRGNEEAHPMSLAAMRRLATSYGGSLDFSNGTSRGTFLRWSARLDAPATPSD